MILDSGALVAIERNDRRIHALLLAALDEGDEVMTHPMVVAQVWRDGRGRQARLAQLLRAVQIVDIDDTLGRRCGELLGASKTADPIDAAVVLIAPAGSAIVTSDPDDLRHLARVAKRTVTVVAC